LKSNANLLDRMDTSDLPRDHPCYITERKKIPRLFSDETKGQPITEFIALRAKSYAYILNKEKIKAKGVRGHVIKNHMTFRNHFDCLFADDDKDNSKLYNRENVSIRSFNHRIRTIKSKKLCFNREDDKRIVQTNRIHTYAYGHFKFDC